MRALRDDATYRPPGGESHDDLVARVVPAWERVVARAARRRRVPPQADPRRARAPARAAARPAWRLAAARLADRRRGVGRRRGLGRLHQPHLRRHVAGPARRRHPTAFYARGMTYAGDVTPQRGVCRRHRARGRPPRRRAHPGRVDLRRGARARRRAPTTSPSSSGRPSPTGGSTSGSSTRCAPPGSQAGRPVYLLCRSGVRSRAAAEALTAAGLGPAFNVLEGFEGPHDARGPPHRGRLEGRRPPVAAGLSRGRHWTGTRRPAPCGEGWPAAVSTRPPRRCS